MKDKVYGFNLIQGKVVMTPSDARDPSPVADVGLLKLVSGCFSNIRDPFDRTDSRSEPIIYFDRSNTAYNHKG